MFLQFKDHDIPFSAAAYLVDPSALVEHYHIVLVPSNIQQISATPSAPGALQLHVNTSKRLLSISH